MDDAQYWAERALIAEQSARDQSDKLLVNLKREYAAAQKDISKQLNGWYQKYADENGISKATARKRLTAAEQRQHNGDIEDYIAKAKTGDPIYDQELRQRYVSSRVNRLQALQDQAAVQLELLGKSQDTKTYKLLQETYKDAYYRSLHSAASKVSIMGRFDRFNPAVVEQICKTPWSGKSFSERIWHNNNKLIKEVRSILSQGATQGTSVDKMSRQLAQRMGVDYHRAECLIRTESAFVRGQATADAYAQMGIDRYQYLATLDNRTSRICRSLDNQVFELRQKAVGINYPPMHPRCRSTTIPYYDDEFTIDETRAARDDGKTVLVNGKMNYNEWRQTISNNHDNGLTLSAASVIITSVADVQTWEAMETYLNSEYDITIDAAVMQLDFEAVRQPLIGVESIFREFPEVAEGIKAIVTSESGVMACSGSKISFNPRYFDRAETLSDLCKQSSVSHWWIPASSPASIGAHEAAHALEWAMINMNPGCLYDFEKVMAWNDCSYAKGIVSQACKNVKKTPYGKGKVNDELIGSVSQYAKASRSETIAEAFADIYANGESANPLSVEIKQLMIERLKQYRGG